MEQQGEQKKINDKMEQPKPKGRPRKTPQEAKPIKENEAQPTENKPKGRPRKTPQEAKPIKQNEEQPKEDKPKGRPRKTNQEAKPIKQNEEQPKEDKPKKQKKIKLQSEEKALIETELKLRQMREAERRYMEALKGLTKPKTK